MPLRIMPNPVSGHELRADMAHLPSGKVDWQILNLSGQLIQQGVSQIGGGQDLVFRLPIGQIPGCYILQTRTGSQVRSGKWIKMN